MFGVVLVAAMFQVPLKLPQSRTPIADTSPFRRLDLFPSPSSIREGTGRPGPNYWQQRVDYQVSASLDAQAHRVTGSQTVTYHNNSPDTLRYLWFQVDQNLFKDGSRGSFLAAPDARFAAAGFEGGINVTNVQVIRGGGPAVRGRPAAREERATITPLVNGTMMRLDLDQPLPPKQSIRLAMDFAFNVPEHGADRMGRAQYDGRWLYEIAQWQPRAAVYDDIRGWNTEQYLGQGEFYREFGDWDVSITAPRDYVVLATGTLQNRSDVMTPDEIRRQDAALHSDTTIPIITRAEAGTAASRPAGSSPTLTWHFKASNVHDVAWAAAPNFIWDASGWNGILMQSFYPVSSAGDTAWTSSTRMVRHTIQHYSEKWFQYPWPTAINIAGPVEGMEYPQIVFCSAGAQGHNLYDVTTHELGHEWFPMIVSSNERLYPWMDEGFNTFINIYSTLTYYNQPETNGPTGQAGQLGQFMRTGYDVPIITPADRIDGRLLGIAGYFKPGGGLYILRHAMLGDTTRFDSAFREYIRRWAFHHPTPADFFRSMNDDLGEDLSFFWRGWFLRTDHVDQAVDSVVTHDSAGVSNTLISLSMPGTLPMPVDLKVTYSDGTNEMIRLPVEIWYLGNHYVWIHHFAKQVARVDIDPDMNFPDTDRSNNSWPRAGAGAPATP